MIGNLAQPATLRARKKLETRETIAAAAMRLALRDGLDRLRIEDIAAEANVSVRTFSNYFESKADALTSYYAARMRYAAADLRTRPPGEPLWDAVVQAILTPWCGVARGHVAPDTASVAELRLLFDVPAVQAGVMRASLAPGNPFAAAVAERTGTDAAADLYPRLVTATVAAAMQVAIGTFLRSDPPQPLIPIVREALALLAAGLPEPVIRQRAALDAIDMDEVEQPAPPYSACPPGTSPPGSTAARNGGPARLPERAEPPSPESPAGFARRV